MKLSNVQTKAELKNQLKEKYLISDQKAEAAIDAVVKVFSRRVTLGERQDAESQLESSLKEIWGGQATSERVKNFFTPDSNSVGYKYKTLEEFYGKVKEEMKNRGFEPNEDTVRTSDVTKTVLFYVKDMLTPGEADDIAAQLPTPVEEVWTGLADPVFTR